MMASRGQTNFIAELIFTLLQLSQCVELPPAVIDSVTTSSFKINWPSAPDPVYAIKHYEVALEYPPGTPTAGSPVRITASAGASHTFGNLDAAREYGVRLDAVLQDDTSAGLNIHDSVWTLPYPPTDVVFRRSGDENGTLTWTAATPPVDKYELVVIPEGRLREVHLVPKEANNIELRNLLPGTTYGFHFTSIVNTPLSTKHQVIKSEPASVQIAEPYIDYALTVSSITASSAYLSWQRSVNDGNSDSYKVTVVDALGLFPSKTYVVPLSENPGQLVTGLIPGTDYSISFAVGTNGIATTVSRRDLSTLPLPPSFIILEENNDGSLALNWLPPLEGNVDNYVIKYGSYGVEEQVVVASNVNQYTTPPLVDKSLQYMIKLYSSIGPNQRLLSVEGVIIASGDFSLVVNPSCKPSPCLNNATCDMVPISTGYTCTCPGGFMGFLCETEVMDPCDSHQCENNGRCVVVEGQDDVFQCNCQQGFTGSFCENDEDNPQLENLTIWIVVFSVLGTLLVVVVIFAIVSSVKKKKESSPDLINQQISPY